MSSMEIDTDKNEKLRKLLEFYFGDSNLMHDRFLKQKVEADPEGFVDISVLCTFNKLKEITIDQNLIAEVAKQSANLKVDGTSARIGRTKPLPDNINMDIKTVFVERYPAAPDTRQFIEELFASCGHVVYVSVPKNVGGGEKGFAFVEFERQEQATKAIKELNTIGNPDHVPAAPNGMRVMSKDSWQRLKDEHKELLFRLSRKKTAFSAAPEPGLIVHFSNVGPNVASKDIKMAFKAYAPIAYVDYDSNKRAGYARFKTIGGAKTTVEKVNNSKLELGGQQIACRVVSGDEEQNYWEKIHQEAAHKHSEIQESHKHNHANNNNNHKNNTNTNNNNNNYPRKQKNTTEESPNKKQKKDNKQIKVKGKKQANILKTKPKTHVIFGDDEDMADNTNTNSSTDNTNSEPKKRPAEDGDSNIEAKRVKTEATNNE